MEIDLEIDNDLPFGRPRYRRTLVVMLFCPNVTTYERADLFRRSSPGQPSHFSPTIQFVV